VLTRTAITALCIFTRTGLTWKLHSSAILPRLLKQLTDSGNEDYDMFQMVSILRAGHLMASSRFHGIVTSMPALVPSAGITMDERIRNLMRERGHEDLLMNVDDPNLEPKLLVALEKLATDGDRIADGIGRTVVRNLKTMARMGVYFEEELRRRYPEFPTRKGEWSWEDYLPPLDEGLRRLTGMYQDSKMSA
jgi:hypothetical protein